jgi:hypothetical protein
LRSALETDAEGAVYPRDRLSGLQSALMVFCAAFLGRQDCVWVAEAGLEYVTAVDSDQERLQEMAGIYPADWGFVADDAFTFAARRYADGGLYDLVSLDPPTQLFQAAADAVELWCGLADRLVVIGTGRDTTLEPPAGWAQTDRITRTTRTGGVYWTILEPAHDAERPAA